jgi:hypothetical protein
MPVTERKIRLDNNQLVALCASMMYPHFYDASSVKDIDRVIEYARQIVEKSNDQ